MGKKASSELPSCEIKGAGKTSGQVKNRNALYRHKGDFRWQGVKDESYKTEQSGWAGIIRRVLIGAHGESSKFHVRYFEIARGGCSSLESHRHEHVVICVRGEGIVRTGNTRRKMGFMDTVYISPDTVHQLINPCEDPFGFLCIVNAKRDKPKVMSSKEKRRK